MACCAREDLVFVVTSASLSRLDLTARIRTVLYFALGSLLMILVRLLVLFSLTPSVGVHIGNGRGNCYFMVTLVHCWCVFSFCCSLLVVDFEYFVLFFWLV
jgi:hypothetical protein